MASLTLIFTRSSGTLQPTRSLGRVSSNFNWQSEDRCQRTHSKWVFIFILHLKSKYSHLILSKLSRKSTIAMTAHYFGALPQVHAIGHCVIDQECDLLWPDCWGREFQHSKYKFSSDPKILKLTGKCGMIAFISIGISNHMPSEAMNVITYPCLD